MIIDQTKTSPSRLLGAADFMRIGAEDSHSLFGSRVAVLAPGEFTLMRGVHPRMRNTNKHA